MEEAALPADFAEAAFLLRTQWTHQDYESAPDDLINRMIMLMNAEAEVSKEHLQEAQAVSKRR